MEIDLDALVAELERKQAALGPVLAHRLELDVERGQATYLAEDGEVVRVALVPVTSYGVHSGTTRWAWANPDLSLPDAHGEKAFRKLARSTGVEELRAASPLTLSRDEARGLLALVADRLGGAGVISESYGDTIWTFLITDLRRDADARAEEDWVRTLLYRLFDQDRVDLFNTLRARHDGLALSFVGADLRGDPEPWKGDLHVQQPVDLGYLRDSEERRLDGVDLSGCRLDEVNLRGVSLRDASLSGSVLVDADLSGADLRGADLRGAFLNGASFVQARMAGARLAGAEIGRTLFCDLDLSEVHGLEDLRHSANSEISFSALVRSGFRVSEQFLRSAGVSPGLLDDLRRGKRFASRYQTCFISYSSKDADFAQALYYALTEAGVRVWLDQTELLAGDGLSAQLRQAIEEHDRTIPILSLHSLESEWVEMEIRTALYYRRQGLTPVRLCPLEPIQAFVGDRGIKPDIVKEYRILDFTDWRDRDSFAQGRDLLLETIRR